MNANMNKVQNDESKELKNKNKKEDKSIIKTRSITKSKNKIINYK